MHMASTERVEANPVHFILVALAKGQVRALQAGLVRARL